MGARKVKPYQKTQKKTALAPDTAFERVREWAEQNTVAVICAGAVIVLAGLLVWGFIAHERSNEARARSDYGLIASRLHAASKGGPAEWEKLIPDLRKFISAHGGTAPALDARIDLAKAYFETKRYGDAIKTGEEALKLAPPGNSLRPLILYQLGYAYESDGKPDKAAEVWTSLKQLDVPELEREADWNLGRIYEGKKEFAKAAEMYEFASEAPGDYPSATVLSQQIAVVKAAK